MIIKISDYMWGIDRRSGERKETHLSSETFSDVSLNQELDVNGKQFIVVNLSENSITLKYYKSEMTINVNERYLYKPRSFDGGHYYIITVTA